MSYAATAYIIGTHSVLTEVNHIPGLQMEELCVIKHSKHHSYANTNFSF